MKKTRTSKLKLRNQEFEFVYVKFARPTRHLSELSNELLDTLSWSSGTAEHSKSAFATLLSWAG